MKTRNIKLATFGFAAMLLSFDVERPISLAALNYAQNSDQEIFLITQKDISNDMPELNDLYEYGVVCRIRQLVRQPGGKLCKVTETRNAFGEQPPRQFVFRHEMCSRRIN